MPSLHASLPIQMTVRRPDLPCAPWAQLWTSISSAQEKYVERPRQKNHVGGFLERSPESNVSGSLHARTPSDMALLPLRPQIFHRRLTRRTPAASPVATRLTHSTPHRPSPKSRRTLDVLLWTLCTIITTTSSQGGCSGRLTQGRLPPCKEDLR